MCVNDKILHLKTVLRSINLYVVKLSRIEIFLRQQQLQVGAYYTISDIHELGGPRTNIEIMPTITHIMPINLITATIQLSILSQLL